MQMSVSVIISSFNGARFLPRLLDSLSSQLGATLEIIVVDRQSSDNSLEILKNYPDTLIVQEPPESGLVAGYTAGATIATHEHLFFCNEDMWFDEHCIRKLEEKIDLGQRIGAADPWQWSYDGSQWLHGGVAFQRKKWDIDSPHPRYKINFTVSLDSGMRVPLPCAGAFLIHRDVFQEIGGWDTSFFLDDEDIDLFIRAWQKDWLCVTVPEAKVYHAVGASNEQNLATVKQSVSTRRYISHCTSTLIIAIKYFSLSTTLLGAANWLVRLTNNLVKLRFKIAFRDLLVVKQVFQRLPEALEFRSKNSEWNRRRPGQRFFSQSEFQVN
jgi:GT2 family glycosyltransferase